MIISIASGKGGTGKTSVAVNLALSIGNAQLLDCDVEEPNAHLLLHPDMYRKELVHTLIPQANRKLCNNCGDCADFCQYNAIFVSSEKVLVFPELCHSCGGCAIVCPKKAISWEKYVVGSLNFGVAGDLTLVFGELQVNKPLSIPIIRAVKKQIRMDCDVILDSPPGTSCSLVETVKNSDFCVLVAEPTPFGLHDLKLTVDVLQKIRVPFGVIVNRSGMGDKKVYEYCKKRNIQLLLEIPFERKIAELYSEGIPFSSEMPEWEAKFQALYQEIKGFAKK